MDVAGTKNDECETSTSSLMACMQHACHTAAMCMAATHFCHNAAYMHKAATVSLTALLNPRKNFHRGRSMESSVIGWSYV